MQLRYILGVMATLLLCGFAAATGTAAEGRPMLSEIRAENGTTERDYRFSAAASEVTPNDQRYQVWLELAQTNGDFKEGAGALRTQLNWDAASARWTVTTTVERFGRDKTRLFRMVIYDALDGRDVFVSAVQRFYAPNRAEPISQQEVKVLLERLAQAYAARNQQEFMRFVSTDFAGDEFILANAVRKDFQLLSDSRIQFYNVGIAAANSQFATVTTGYRRAVTTFATGERINDSGVTELTVHKEKGQLKLYSMKKPLLFGLAYDGKSATGTVVSEQNRKVTQIKRDGTIVVGPVTTERPAVKTIVLHGTDAGQMQSTVEALAIASASKTVGNNPQLAKTGMFAGDVALLSEDANNVTATTICFSGSGVQLVAAADINSVRSVPESGYLPRHITFYGNPPDPLIFAIRLTDGRYAVVQFTNIIGGNNVWQSTVLYKYQPDGTKNF